HMLVRRRVLLCKGSLRHAYHTLGKKCSRLLDAVVLYEVPVVVFEEDFHTRPLYIFHRPDLSDNAAPEQHLGPVAQDICTHVLREYIASRRREDLLLVGVAWSIDARTWASGQQKVLPLTGQEVQAEHSAP